LEAYDETEREITYHTFAKHLGADVMRELCKLFGYTRRNKMTMRRDWHLSYGKGFWNGNIPVVCLYHSRIHHLWQINHTTR
jgi:hypothetical protein